MRSYWAACVWAALAAGCSPFGNGDVFNCTSDSQCMQGSQQGICTPTAIGGVCAFNGGSACGGGYAIGSHSGAQDGTCVAVVDGGTQPVDAPHAPADAALLPDAEFCVGTTLRLCMPAAPVTDLSLTGTVNTDTQCAFTAAQGAGFKDLCVVTGATITLANVHATGSRPLVVLAGGSITVSGPVDATYNGALGNDAPGADAGDACAGVQGASNNGGGAGGSFGTAGGDGGNGAGGGKGKAGPALTAAAIRGGCAGANGSGFTSARGGHAGGAIYLLANGNISIAADLTANGSGGGGGDPNLRQLPGGGGGGGGTGGFLGLEGTHILVSGHVIAAGGGGGGGGSQGAPGPSGGPGKAGTDGSTGSAPGGAGGTPGGGAGGASAAAGAAGTDGHDGTSTGAGGGGGGGAGIIWVTGDTSGVDPAKFFPPFVPK